MTKIQPWVTESLTSFFSTFFPFRDETHQCPDTTPQGSLARDKLGFLGGKGREPLVRASARAGNWVQRNEGNPEPRTPDEMNLEEGLRCSLRAERHNSEHTHPEETAGRF